MGKFLNLVLCMFVGLLALAQQPELTVEQHLEDFDFAVKYIEDNYAGFPDKVVDTTRADYEASKAKLRAQVELGERPGWDAAAQYMAWFNDAHLSIHVYYKDEKGDYVGLTESYNHKKKRIHYNGSMDYSPKTVACKVTDKTFLIRYPSCDGNPSIAENLIKQFKKSHCENLIIDIRGNGGGNDANWAPFEKLLYNHKAWIQGAEYRNTPQNLAKILEYGWPVGKRLVKLSSKNPNDEYINKGAFLIRHKKVDKTVRKAAVIVDNQVASSGEGLVLGLMACSDRVTFYGRDNTCGCLDNANVAIIPLKHAKRNFQMPMSRKSDFSEEEIQEIEKQTKIPRNRANDLIAQGIDANGIAPDVRIPLPLPAKLADNIDEWVIWVAEQLEK